MSEESFLRYRLEVVRLMPEGEHKRALIAAINRSLVILSGAGTSPRDSRAVRLLAAASGADSASRSAQSCVGAG